MFWDLPFKGSNFTACPYASLAPTRRRRTWVSRPPPRVVWHLPYSVVTLINFGRILFYVKAGKKKKNKKTNSFPAYTMHGSYLKIQCICIYIRATDLPSILPMQESRTLASPNQACARRSVWHTARGTQRVPWSARHTSYGTQRVA